LIDANLNLVNDEYKKIKDEKKKELVYRVIRKDNNVF